MSQDKLFPDRSYTYAFHSPGIEPWILGLLKKKKSLGKVLDIGCGLGFWGFMLKNYVGNYNQLIGLDISEKKLEKLKALNIYDELVVADASELPFRDRSFDTIIAIEVLLGFISDSVLRELERVLREGGLVVMTLPGLPKSFGTSKLLTSGYKVYAYILRGYFLLNLKNGKVLSIYNTPLTRLLKIILRTASKVYIKAKKNSLYLLSFKVKGASI